MHRHRQWAQISAPVVSRCARRLFTQVESQYDVVIVGGGMIGAAMACSLKHSAITRPLKVAIVDRAPAQQVPMSTPELEESIPGIRVSTMTPSTSDFLMQVGVWEHLAPPASSCFDKMQIWDTSGKSFMSFSSSDNTYGYLGHVIENDILKYKLQERARELGCEFMYDKVTDIALPQPKVGITKDATLQTPGDGRESSSSSVTISLESGQEIITPLVVGADGANSVVLEKAGIRTVNYQYGQRAVTATVSTSFPNNTAFQRFLPTGPLALLPVRGGYSNIVWSTSISEAKELERMDPEHFAEAVNRALSEDYEGDLSITPSVGNKGSEFDQPPEILSVVGETQRSFPLSMKHAMTYCRKGAVLIGDAAHSIHPLAGQGVNLGFGDVAVLQKVLDEAVWSGQSYSDLLTLEKYSQSRKVSNSAMIAALDSVKILYQSQAGLVSFFRNLGMDLLNTSNPLKRLIVSYASSNGFIKRGI